MTALRPFPLLRLACWATLSSFFAVPAAAVTITLFPGPTFASVGTAQALDGFAVTDTQAVNPTAVPFTATSNAAVPVATNETRYLLSNSALEIQFDHTFGIPPGSGGVSFGSISFRVDVDVPYRLEGVYSAAATKRYFMVQAAQLNDNSSSAVLFQGRQESFEVANESFSLGGVAGDGLNQFAIGSLTGTLTAGDVHTLMWRSSIQQLPDVLADETTGSATGFLRLLLVPEPATVTLLAVGLSGFAALARRPARPRYTRPA